MVNSQLYTYVYTHTHTHVLTLTYVSTHMHTHIAKSVPHHASINSVTREDLVGESNA